MPSQAPVAAVEQPEVETPAAPPPEQLAPAAPPNQAPAKPDPAVELQQFRADYTRKTQKWAAAARELGLDAASSPEDILGAVVALRHQADAAAEPARDDGITDPRYVELERKAREDLWRAQVTVHGPVAEAGKELQSFLARTHDPEAITDKVYEVLSRFAAEPEAPAGSAGETTEEPATEPEPEPSFGIMDSGSRTGGTVEPSTEVTDEFRNTGNVEGWLGKLLRPKR